MKLCADVGLGPGYIVLDGDPASPPKMAHSPPPIRGPCLLCQIAGWIEMPLGKEVGLDQPRRHCVRWGPSSPPKRATEKPPTLFGPCILWPNGWITMPCSMEVSLGLGAGYIVLDGEHQKKGTAPNFRPVSVVDKQLDGSRCHFMEVDLGPVDIVLHVDPAPQRGRSTHFCPYFCISAHDYWGQTFAHLSYLLAKFHLDQLNSSQRASMDAGVKTPKCPHLSRHYLISIL